MQESRDIDAFAHETFIADGNIAALLAALAKAALGFKPIVRSKKVRVQPQNKPAYEFVYAPLEEVQDATREALASNGLTVIQPYHRVSGGWFLRTILAHADGGMLTAITFIRDEVHFQDYTTKERLVRPRSAQELGSELTYQRRYSLQCILGINAEDDDDGNLGDGNDRELPPAKTQKTPPPAPARQQPAQQQKPPEQPKAPPPKPEPAKPPEKPPEQPKPEPVVEAKPEPQPEPTPEPVKVESVPPPAPQPSPVNEADDALLPLTDDQKNWMLKELKEGRKITQEIARELFRYVLNRGPSSKDDPLTRGQARTLRAYLEANPEAGKPGWAPPPGVFTP